MSSDPGYSSNSGYGYSSQTMFSPGLDAGVADHILLRPHTSWRGVRGARVNFGSEPSSDAEDYGRLYVSDRGHYLEEASEADPGVLLGRSGRSGLRGGRPVFGAKLEVLGVGSYEGAEIGVFAMGLGVLAIAGKALKLY